MTADAVFDRMEARNLDILGEWATYTARKEVPRRVRVWFDAETNPQVSGFETLAFDEEYTIEGRLDDFRKEPDKGETFELRGMRFSVQATMENDGRTVKLATRRTQ